MVFVQSEVLMWGEIPQLRSRPFQIEFIPELRAAVIMSPCCQILDLLKTGYHVKIRVHSVPGSAKKESSIQPR